MSAEAGVVQSVDRALAIATLLGEAPDGLRLSEIAAAASLPPSTCHRLLSTMERRQFVQFDQRTSIWLVGRQAFRIGAAFVRRSAFVAPAIPMMRTLRDATRETVNIGIPDDGDVIILAQVESREIVRAINIIGGRAPLSSSGLGKAILSTYSDEAFAAHVSRHGLPRCTTHTLTDPAALTRDLMKVRKRGYAIDREEHFMGLHCVAAPVFGAAGEAVAALSVSGLAARMEIARLADVGTLVKEAADTMSRTGLSFAAEASTT